MTDQEYAKAWVRWIGPGHRIDTCVAIPEVWLAKYRARVVHEWHGKILGVYRTKSRALATQPRT